MFTLIVNENISLKLLSSENADELFHLTDKNRKYLSNFLPWLDSIKTVSNSLEFIEVSISQFDTKYSLQTGVFYKNQLVGIIGTHQIDWNNKKTALGYWISEEFQGNGIMIESVKCLIEYGFNELHLNKIEIRCSPENSRSRAIPEKLGMHLDGILRQNEWLYDHFSDNMVFSILKSEWKQRG